MGKTKFRNQTDQRPFTMIYHDFLESELLNTSYQKLLYIYLKKFTDTQNQCFPSIKKLATLTRMSESKVKTTLGELETKGVIKKQNRTRVDGGKSSNLYTLYDYADLWNAKNKEDVEKVIEEYEDKKLISLLESRGYKVTKENEPETSQPTKVEEEPDSNSKNNYVINTNYKANESNCQEVQNIVERYPLEQIKEHFYYEAMVHDNPLQKDDIDSVINILYDALNTTKETIRVNKVNRPTMTVISRLMKLTHLEIMYAIEMYKKQTERVNLSDSYMLTLLYKAKEQMHLNTTNKVQYDMAHQNQTEEVKEQQQNYEENQSVNPMEQAIEVCKNYSKEQEAEYKERYKKTALQGIKQESFDNQGAIRDLEKEWLKPNQGTTLPSEQQRTQSNEESIEVKVIIKSEENYDDYEQRQYSQEFMDDLEVKLLALLGSSNN